MKGATYVTFELFYKKKKERALLYASVLLENNQSRIFRIFDSEDIDDVIYRFLH